MSFGGSAPRAPAPPKGLKKLAGVTSKAAAGAAERLPTENFSLSNVDFGLANPIFQNQLALLQPDFDAQNRDLEVRAAERGLPIGSEAFNALMDPTARAQALAKQNAAFGTIQQQIDNSFRERGLPFQEFATLSGSATPLLNSQANIAQLNFQNQLAQQQSQNAALSSILGSAASTLPFLLSDRRVKTDIKLVGALTDGTPVYRFRYKHGGPMQIGLMADEVIPDSVIEVGGLKFVDYEKATANA